MNEHSREGLGLCQQMEASLGVRPPWRRKLWPGVVLLPGGPPSISPYGGLLKK